MTHKEELVLRVTTFPNRMIHKLGYLLGIPTAWDNIKDKFSNFMEARGFVAVKYKYQVEELRSQLSKAHVSVLTKDFLSKN